MPEIFQIRVAEQVVEIHALYDEVFRQCRDYIVPEQASDIVVRITEEDLIREAEMAHRESGKIAGNREANENLMTETAGTDNRQDRGISLSRYEITAVYRKLVSAMTDTFLMHGSVISTQGQGYMITAPSGIGKTTRTKLWVDEIPDSFVVNGDKPLIRVTEEGIRIYGTPWCGKEGWNTNASVPLRAIFLLERADELNDSEVSDRAAKVAGALPEWADAQKASGTSDRAAAGIDALQRDAAKKQDDGSSVTELTFAEAFPKLLVQTFRPEEIEAKRRTLRMLNALAGKVRFFRFISAPTSQAVRMAWEATRSGS